MHTLKSCSRWLVLLVFLVIFLLPANPVGAYSQEQLQTLFDQDLERVLVEPTTKRNIIYVPYSNDPYLAGIATMAELTHDTKYLDTGLSLIEESLGTMRDIDGDGHVEWEAKYSQVGAFDHDKNAATPPRFNCLWTNRGVRQMIRTVRIIKNDSCFSADYQQRADRILEKIKRDVLNDPYCKDAFLPTYTTVPHILSHSATILAELSLIEGNKPYLDNQQFKSADSATIVGNNIRSSFFKQPNGSVVWGNVGCKELRTVYPDCYLANDAPNPLCNDSAGLRYCHPFDVSHSENTVYTATQLYRSGISFTRNDVTSLVNTLIKNIWNKDSQVPKFYDFTDGRLAPDGSKYGTWIYGSYLAPGWVSLGAWSSEVQSVVENVKFDSSNTARLVKLAYYSELMRNKKVGDCVYSNQAKEISDGKDNDCDGLVDENQRCNIAIKTGDFDGDGRTDTEDYSLLVNELKNNSSNCRFTVPHRTTNCTLSLYDYNEFIARIQ